MSSLPADVQIYLVSLVVGLTAPALIFWMLYEPLSHFLAAIFGRRDIERFWLRVTLMVLYAGTFSAAVGFHPDEAVNDDFVAMIWNLGDQLQSILQALLWSLLALFLPLLLSYTVLHVGRDRTSDTGEGTSAPEKTSPFDSAPS